jgi:hypothetical protein
MIDFKEIPYDDDTWELFARDFLEESGLYIESSPDRGADAGKDLLITENLAGNLNKYQFRWLVSCKHFATSGSSVTEANEPNILERLSTFRADGFIGFYSTIPSSGLNNRLNALRNEKRIKDFTIFDHKRIENHLVTVGYSHLLLRYFPESYKTTKPLHLVADNYEPVLCKLCGKDVLMGLFESGYDANLIGVYRWEEKENIEYILDAYCVCKTCDREVANPGLMSSWTGISDLVIPIRFIQYLFATMNRIRKGLDVYTDEAYEKEINILRALAQKVLRQTTERERSRYKDLMSLPF